MLELLQNYIPIIAACTISLASVVTVNYLFNDIGEVNNLCKNTLNGLGHKLNKLESTLLPFNNDMAKSIKSLDNNYKKIEQHITLLECDLAYKQKITNPDQVSIDEVEEELRLCENVQSCASKGSYIKLKHIDTVVMGDLWKRVDNANAAIKNFNLVDNFFEIASLNTLSTTFLITVTASLLYIIYRLREPLYILPWSVLSWSTYRISFLLNIRTWFDTKLDYINKQLHEIENSKKIFYKHARRIDGISAEVSKYLKGK